MEVFWGDDDSSAVSTRITSSTIAPMFSIAVPETRKVTKVTGHVPKSKILTEVEARKEINMCKAPPKDIPRQLKRDFLTGRKNAAQCLNEVCQLQRWNIKYIETTPSKPFDLYGQSNFAITAIVNGMHYTPGEGKNKKDAKVNGARNALNEILGQNPDQDPAPSSGKEYDIYGREIFLHSQRPQPTVAAQNRQFRPMPRAVIPQKTNFLPAPSRSQTMELLKRNPVQPYESVGTLAERKLTELLSSDPALLGSVQHGAMAAFLVKKAGLPGEVVAVGTGDMCFHGGELCTDGKVLFDCHAETVARRAFRRYLLSQILLWYSGNKKSRVDCIFEKAEDSSLLCLKDSVTIHIYMNKLPKGLARSENEITPASVNDEWNLTFVQSSGHVETRVMSNIPVLVTASDVLSMAKKKMPTMSGSDKMLKWNVCGIQGSLLSLFIEPVCLASITIGYDSDVCDCNALSAAVNRRLNESLNPYLPDMFFVNHIHKIGSYIVKQPKSVEALLESKENLSVNWTKGDTKIEILKADGGKVDACSPTGLPDGQSRLSKAAFYSACQQLNSDTENSVLQRSENYHTAKQSSRSYQETKRIFHGHLLDNGFGYWISRPKQVDCFKS